MKNYLPLFVILALLLHGCEDPKKPDQSVSNVNLYHNGDILTMASNEPEYVEAVVEQEGKIVYVGSMKGAEDHKGRPNDI